MRHHRFIKKKTDFCYSFLRQRTKRKQMKAHEMRRTFKVKEKSEWYRLGCLVVHRRIQERHAWKSFWLFFDAHLDNVEILAPTLDVIEDLKRDGLIYAVKQFKSMREFKIMDKLRYQYGMASYRFATSCVGHGLFRDAFIAMMTNTPMPSNDEIQKEIDRKRFTFVDTEEDVKKLDDRKLWYQRMIEHQYNIALHVLHMFAELRVYNLMTMERASIKELDLSSLDEDV